MTVISGGKYILADDVSSNGGEVVAAVSMAVGGFGDTIALTKQTRLDLENKFGVESLQQFLQEEGLYGGNYQSLTEPEGRTLLRAATLDEARNRIAAARQKGNRSILPGRVQGHQGDISSQEINSPDSNDIFFQLIGEQGAQALDRAEEATTRLDNLGIARQMEEAGKDAKAVRLATGWERGADGKWRYEN